MVHPSGRAVAALAAAGITLAVAQPSRAEPTGAAAFTGSWQGEIPKAGHTSTRGLELAVHGGAISGKLTINGAEYVIDSVVFNTADGGGIELDVHNVAPSAPGAAGRAHHAVTGQPTDRHLKLERRTSGDATWLHVTETWTDKVPRVENYAIHHPGDAAPTKTQLDDGQDQHYADQRAQTREHETGFGIFNNTGWTLFHIYRRDGSGAWSKDLLGSGIMHGDDRFNWTLAGPASSHRNVSVKVVFKNGSTAQIDGLDLTAVSAISADASNGGVVWSRWYHHYADLDKLAGTWTGKADGSPRALKLAIHDKRVTGTVTGDGTDARIEAAKVIYSDDADVNLVVKFTVRMPAPERLRNSASGPLYVLYSVTFDKRSASTDKIRVQEEWHAQPDESWGQNRLEENEYDLHH